MEKPQQIVARGYDRIARRYLEWIGSMDMEVRNKYLGVLNNLVLAGADVLDLGCGAGLPMTRSLAGRYRVTGLDLSPVQLRLAQANLPGVPLVLGDMTRLGFAAACFHAVTVFYAATHVPREEHPDLLMEIHRVLRPGGVLVATMGSGDTSGCVEEDWLGVPMFFSHYPSAENDALVRQAGFEILSAQDEWESEESTPVCFHWIVARKN